MILRSMDRLGSQTGERCTTRRDVSGLSTTRGTAHRAATCCGSRVEARNDSNGFEDNESWAAQLACSEKAMKLSSTERLVQSNRPAKDEKA